MGVIRVDCLCECEGCGKVFGIEIDLASDLVYHLDFESLVSETIHNGNNTGYILGVRGKATIDRMPLEYQVTIQGGLIICDTCSKICYDLPIEGDLTEEQVKIALGRR